MYPFRDSGGDDFFGGGGMGRGMGGLSGGMGGMRGMDGGPIGGMGRGGGMSDGNPRQGGYSFFSSFDSSRPQDQQYQERHEPFGDYQGGSRGGGGGAGNKPAPRDRGFIFSGLTRADTPFRTQRTASRTGGYNPSGNMPEEPGYRDEYQQRPSCVDPRFTSQYEEYPRGSGQRGQGGERSGRLFDFGHLGPARRQQPSGQQGYYDDDSDSEDEDVRPQLSYAPQQGYGGGGSARRTGGGRLFNYDRFARGG